MFLGTKKHILDQMKWVGRALRYTKKWKLISIICMDNTTYLKKYKYKRRLLRKSQEFSSSLENGVEIGWVGVKVDFHVFLFFWIIWLSHNEAFHVLVA